MVAGTSDLYFIADRHPDRICRWFCHCSIYLHSVLMKDKHLGTILIFVIVLIIFFLIYKNVKLLYAALALGAIAIFVPALSRKIQLAISLRRLVAYSVRQMVTALQLKRL